jgi:hypothetical protein
MSESTTTAAPPRSLAERYRIIQTAYVLNVPRLRELEAKSESSVLSDQEVDQVVHLRLQCANQATILGFFAHLLSCGARHEGG